MTKTQFFKENAGRLVKFSDDDGEYGDFLILHPEEIDAAKQLQDNGYTIVSVHETVDGEDYVDISQPCDFGTQPFKYGYFAISK